MSSCHKHRPRSRLALGLQLAVLSALLSACGGESESNPPTANQDCSLPAQKASLGSYMNDWYFWYALSPRPDPAPYDDVQSYFGALLYTGGNASFPADRWSGSQTTESFNRFFGDGASLGYGLAVAGLELDRDGSLPLYVRTVEPLSPAAAQGVQRGDRVMSLNGRPASELIAADDFSALSAQQAGDSLTMVLRRNGLERTLVLRAEVFNLTPVTGTTVVTTAGGRRLAYVAVKDMVSQALAPMETAFARFRAEAVQDLVLDLRYNGGGLVSTSATLASYLAGARSAGQVYASLLYNDKRASNNQTFRFGSQVSALDLPRVFVLMGRRTCSASEQLINGLLGAGIDVVAIGETSCGKPVGFLPTSTCGRTYSVVNFESVNQRNEGRYFDGLSPSCAVAEDFSTAQASNNDPLMTAARAAADNGGVCPQTVAGRLFPQSAPPGQRARQPRRTLSEGDFSPGMIPR